MNIAFAIATVAALAATNAQAQIPGPTTAFIVHAKERPMMRVFSWERNGKFTSAFPGSKIEVPYDAAKIDVAIFAFPNGMVRHIHFDAGTRTHPNVAHEDILFYQLSGRRVQIINERSGEVNPGDASLQLSGVRKRMDQIIGGDMVEFAMLRPKRDGVEGLWAPANEVPAVEVVDPSGSRYQGKTFKLGPYVLYEARLPKGARMAPQKEAQDTYFFVGSGKLDAVIGDTRDVVEANAAMQAPAGTPFGFEALEDTLLVYAPILKAPAK